MVVCLDVLAICHYDDICLNPLYPLPINTIYVLAKNSKTPLISHDMRHSDMCVYFDTTVHIANASRTFHFRQWTVIARNILTPYQIDAHKDHMMLTAETYAKLTRNSSPICVAVGIPSPSVRVKTRSLLGKLLVPLGTEVRIIQLPSLLTVFYYHSTRFWASMGAQVSQQTPLDLFLRYGTLHPLASLLQ